MVSREFSGTPPSFESIRSNPKYKPSIHLTAYTPGTFTLENIREAEAKTRIMTNYIHSFGFSNFSFVYVMKDPIPPPESVYKGLSGVKQSDIRCSERLAIDEKKYPKMQAAANLKEFYSKGCSYETKNGSGGGMVRGRYPE